MAHIVDGVLANEIVITATALSAGGVALGLRQTDIDEIPRVALMAATFFVTSLVYVPIGPSSSHLLLVGLIGLVLGWRAFPAILVGVALQAVLFGFGGLTVLGVNTLNIALPAVACHLILGRINLNGKPAFAALVGAAAGVLGIAGVAVMVAAELALTGKAFVPVAYLVLMAHLPVIATEAAVTGAAMVLILKVRPETLSLGMARRHA